MSLRVNLSDAVKKAKKLSGMTYEDIGDATGLSKSSIRYALNGGDKVGLDAMDTMVKSMGFCLEITLEKDE